MIELYCNGIALQDGDKRVWADLRWNTANSDMAYDMARVAERAQYLAGQAHTANGSPIDMAAIADQLAHGMLSWLHATRVRADVHMALSASEPFAQAGASVTAESENHVTTDSDAVSPAPNKPDPLAQKHEAIVGMESAATNAADLMRASIVMFDSIPGNQIIGISPLYHVAAAQGAGTSTAVLAIETTMSLADLIRALEAVSMTHEGIVHLSVVAFDNKSVPDAMQPGTWAQGNSERAAFLSPWMDMDPDATLDGNPVPFLLASAPDAMFAGLESDHWIIGGAQ
ncbi:hypothetical protein [Bifidobacterium magnum]|uniref:Uncharacterized protein n=1 Tax=Bifidobacterium magnum TaxID=1692 RepID=A0A087BBM0_9BIFI|nr:hypothetical protein [Bifidobacterium magnum]KFI68420.1 hypothetical protein BMAGN_0381 [Bifidobacterium magnum]